MPPAGGKEQVSRGPTLLTPESTEAGVALAGVVVDGLHTLPVATAGRRGTGSCRKHHEDESRHYAYDAFPWV